MISPAQKPKQGKPKTTKPEPYTKAGNFVAACETSALVGAMVALLNRGV